MNIGNNKAAADHKVSGWIINVKNITYNLL